MPKQQNQRQKAIQGLFITNKLKQISIQKIVDQSSERSRFQQKSQSQTRMFNKNIPKNQHIDSQIGQLLAFIILFEKKIQELRIKLAGNEEFHSRLAFQLMDKRRKCNISPQDLADVINRHTASKPIQQVEAFCRKYTSNGAFSYDQFIKFLTPKTNKILAQRLMIRTYRQGTTLPANVISLLLQTFATAITMTTVTENLRRQLQSNTELTHLQILQLFRKCCTSREKLFYFINASTNGEGDYDFMLEEMDFLVFHVRGKCDLEDISDQQIKQILCTLDMNYQKHQTSKSGFGTTNAIDSKTKTEYFKTKTSFTGTQNPNENDEPFRKTVNFLKTNYQQTSKNFYQPRPANQPTKPSREMFLQALDENVQTKPPTPMMNQKNFPTQNLVLDHYAILSNQQPPQQRFSMPGTFSQQQQHDTSSISQINYGNMYIEKFTRGQGQNLAGWREGGQKSRQIDNYLVGKYDSNYGNHNQRQDHRQKELFYDQFNRYGLKNNNNPLHDDYYESDSVSANDSAFVQY